MSKICFAYIQNPIRRESIKSHFREAYQELWNKTKNTKVMFREKNSGGKFVYIDPRSVGNMFGVSTKIDRLLGVAAVDETGQRYLNFGY